MHSSVSLALALVGLARLADAALRGGFEAVCANDGLTTLEAAQVTLARPSCDTAMFATALQVSRTAGSHEHSLLETSTAATTQILSTSTAAVERFIHATTVTSKAEHGAALAPSEIPTASLRIVSNTRTASPTSLAASSSISRVSRIRSAILPAAADDVTIPQQAAPAGNGFTVRWTSAVASVTSSSYGTNTNQTIRNAESTAARSQTGPKGVSTPFMASYATDAISRLNSGNYSTEAVRSVQPVNPLATFAGVAPSVTARVPTSTSATGTDMLLHLPREPAAVRQLQLVRVAEHVYGAPVGRKA